MGGFAPFSLGDAVLRAEQFRRGRLIDQQRAQQIGVANRNADLRERQIEGIEGRAAAAADAAETAAAQEQGLRQLTQQYLADGDENALSGIAQVDPQRAERIRELRAAQQPAAPDFSSLQGQAEGYRNIASSLRQLPAEQRAEVARRQIAAFPDSPLKEGVARAIEDGNLTDEEIAAFDQQLTGLVQLDSDPSAFERDVEAIMQANGVDRNTAVNVKLGVIRPVTDPVSGQTRLVNMATQRPGATVGGAQAAPEPSPSADRSAERQRIFGPDGQRRLDLATGPIEQPFRRGVNAVVGALGADPVFPDTESSARALDVIRRDLARQESTDGGNRLLVTIYRDVLKDFPTATTTDATARQQFNEVLRRMDDEIGKLEGALARPDYPASAKATAIEALEDLNLNRRRLLEFVQGTQAPPPEDGLQTTPGGARFRVVQ